MIIFGWNRQPTILGSKVDQCATCGVTGPHLLVRKTWWVTIFWVPVLLLRFQHGMACAACGAWTGIGFRTMRRAMKTGRLALPGRKRPDALEVRAQITEDTGHRPSETELYDTVTVNPRRGAWDLALKLWPLAVVGLVVVVAVGAALPPAPQPTPAARPAAHTCWLDETGNITGCQYLDGTIEGDAVGTETTCYFAEPLPTDDVILYCP